MNNKLTLLTANIVDVGIVEVKELGMPNKIYYHFTDELISDLFELIIENVYYSNFFGCLHRCNDKNEFSSVIEGKCVNCDVYFEQLEIIVKCLDKNEKNRNS